MKRWLVIWFPYLLTDWFTRKNPGSKSTAFVFAVAEHGKMIITAVSQFAENRGIQKGMAVADARAICPGIKVLDDKPERTTSLLKKMGEYCIRYSPVVAVDQPDGLIIDATGCFHLWKGEESYINAIQKRLTEFGYEVRLCMADTIGAAWAICRYGKEQIIQPAAQKNALMGLTPPALRVEFPVLELCYKLGLRQIKDFIDFPRKSLIRRFGSNLVLRIEQALGIVDETIEPVQLPKPYEERLACLELIITAKGIEIALKELIEKLCDKLRYEQKGIRKAVFQCFRIDGDVQSISIGTNKASANSNHLYKLFEIKLDTIEPALGIELFSLSSPVIEDLKTKQEKIWKNHGGLEDLQLIELVDHISNKIGNKSIRRFLPAEHYWPERSVIEAKSLDEIPASSWKLDRPRPTRLLSIPEKITVTAPIPDYPPMLFRYNGVLHTIKKADGPERIEREWWMDDGRMRDYYSVEDENGNRYWIFRSGHYSDDKNVEWYIHGFFA